MTSSSKWLSHLALCALKCSCVYFQELAIVVKSYASWATLSLTFQCVSCFRNSCCLNYFWNVSSIQLVKFQYVILVLFVHHMVASVRLGKQCCYLLFVYVSGIHLLIICWLVFVSVIIGLYKIADAVNLVKTKVNGYLILLVHK